MFIIELMAPLLQRVRSWTVSTLKWTRQDAVWLPLQRPALPNTRHNDTIEKELERDAGRVPFVRCAPVPSRPT